MVNDMMIVVAFFINSTWFYIYDKSIPFIEIIFMFRGTHVSFTFRVIEEVLHPKEFG